MPMPIIRFNRLVSRLKTQNNRYHSTSGFSISTRTEEPAQSGGPPPIRVALTEQAGRGVFATRHIAAGELIHTAKPLVSHPSLSAVGTVCYNCLKRLGPTQIWDLTRFGFCSEECEGVAKVFSDVELKADWSEFDEYCRAQGLKYPLLVKRFACMVIAGAASAESLHILQPAILSHEMVLEFGKGFNLLWSSFAKTSIAEEQRAFLTKQWYNDVLARIRINAFRIELAIGSYEDLLSSAAACVEGEAAVGNAVYVLPSFYNHDCDPNTHIVWIENTNARLKALRNVEEGEELRICYIDASMDRDARQNLLLHGFGFRCNCLRCLSGD